MTTHEIAKKWLNAFNTHDLERLLALYDEHAIHYSPKLKTRQPESNGFVTGKAAIRTWWKDALERLPSLVYREKTITANEECVFMEYTRIVANEEEMNVAEILEIKNGLIVASRVYHG